MTITPEKKNPEKWKVYENNRAIYLIPSESHQCNEIILGINKMQYSKSELMQVRSRANLASYAPEMLKMLEKVQQTLKYMALECVGYPDEIDEMQILIEKAKGGKKINEASADFPGPINL